jgi:hypothetical protein
MLPPIAEPLLEGVGRRTDLFLVYSETAPAREIARRALLGGSNEADTVTAEFVTDAASGPTRRITQSALRSHGAAANPPTADARRPGRSRTPNAMTAGFVDA